MLVNPFAPSNQTSSPFDSPLKHGSGVSRIAGTIIEDAEEEHGSPATLMLNKHHLESEPMRDKYREQMKGSFK